MIRPLNNNCLIEVINENEGIIGSTTDNVQKGVLQDYQLVEDHLTASTGYALFAGVKPYTDQLAKLKGKVVYWQEYADAGSKFLVDGKDYVLVPFYRLIGWEA